MALRVGQQIGNYRLVQSIGTGGFAEVYVGEHIHLSTRAAIKVLNAQLGNVAAAEEFRKEARIVAQLAHSNIIRVLDFGIEEMMPFLVMDYAPHGSLLQSYGHGMTVPLDTIVTQTQQIAEALQYAHEHKIIHRDIKPANILIGAQNQILVSDFGIAIIAHNSNHQSDQEMAGTLAYMAPEQIRSQARPASDQYSLAIMVYEGLCRQRPFNGSLAEIALQQMSVQPPSLHTQISIAPAVENVILKALTKDPTQRFPQVREFAQALEQAAHPKPHLIRAPGPRLAAQPDTFAARYPSHPLPPPTLGRENPSSPNPEDYLYASTTQPLPMQERQKAQEAMQRKSQFIGLPTPSPQSTTVNAPMPKPGSSAFFSRSSFFLLGSYTLFMLLSILPVFIINAAIFPQVAGGTQQVAIGGVVGYLSWIFLLMPLESLMCGILLGGRRGFLAVGLYFLIFAATTFAFKHSFTSWQANLAFLSAPLLTGGVYHLRKKIPPLGISLLILLVTFTVTIFYLQLNTNAPWNSSWMNPWHTPWLERLGLFPVSVLVTALLMLSIHWLKRFSLKRHDTAHKRFLREEDNN